MLEQLTALLAASLGGGAAILVLLTLGPLLTRKVSPHWRYWAWAVVPIIWITSGSWRPEQGEQGGQIPTWAENKCGTVITSTIQTGRAGR